MSPSDDVPQDPTPQLNALLPLARDWAGRRKPADMCIELFVRVLELAKALELLAKMHGIDLDGRPAADRVAHYVPDPDELRVWLDQLLPPQEVSNRVETP